MASFVIYGLNYWPEPIGNAVYTREYAEALVDAGHRVTVVAGYPHYPSWDPAARRWQWTQEHIGGVRVVRIPHAVPRSPTLAGRLQLEATYGMAAVAAISRTWRMDAVIGVVPALAGGLAARLLGIVRQRPSGLLIQDLMSAAASQGGVRGGARVARAVKAVERIALGVDRVAVVGRGFEEPVRLLGARSVDYLPNFATLPDPVESASDVRGRLGLRPEDFVVMYSGNLGFKQDFETVLHAIRALRGQSRLQFVIIGDGSQRTLIERAAQDEALPLTLWPLQPAEDLLSILGAADILLAPQRPTDVDMSVPSKLTAYLSAGRPVIAAASAASETARIVQEARAGVVVAPGDSDRLAEAILLLERDEGMRERLGAAARVYATEVFDRGRGRARFVGWAESLLRSKSPTR